MLGTSCASPHFSKEEMTMTTTATFDASAELDAESDNALHLIRTQRAHRKFAVLSVLGAALLALFGLTYAMYARTPADPQPVRMGTSR